ncbi:MAG TPA: FHA domain-containing protein [Armatimonadetes bacterium]|nr:FHA domain-containing protein [Armatimonadota bacterium]
MRWLERLSEGLRRGLERLFPTEGEIGPAGTFAFNPERPGDIAYLLLDLRGKVRHIGRQKFAVANVHRIFLHPDDIAEAELDAIGDVLREEFTRKLAEAIDLKAGHFALPLPGREKGGQPLSTVQKVRVTIEPDENLPRGQGRLEWEWKDLTAEPGWVARSSAEERTQVWALEEATVVVSPAPQFRGKLVVEEGVEPGREYDWDKPLIRLGRGEAHGNDLILRDFAERTISRVHAEIFRTAEGFVLRDRHSTNGTFVNGERLPEGGERLLQPGDLIGLGPRTTLRFHLEPPAAP